MFSFTAVAFAYVERMLHALNPADAVEKGLAALKSTLPMLENVGFQKLVFEDFYDVLESLLLSIVKPQTTGRTLNAVGLLEAFQSPEGELYQSELKRSPPSSSGPIVSNSIVVYLRLLTVSFFFLCSMMALDIFSSSPPKYASTLTRSLRSFSIRS